MDTKIDERYECTTLLICTKCNTVCSTKNINRIGDRSIKPAWDGMDNHSINYLALDKCNEQGHRISDLRVLTDEEFIEYGVEGNITSNNMKYIEEDFKE